MMTTETREITTIRYKDSSDGEYVWLSGYNRYEDGTYNINVGYHASEALDISDLDITDQFDLYEAFQSEWVDEDVEFISIKMRTETTNLLAEETGEFKELRQRLALNKLNENDIRALGIMNIFTYIKTKYA